MLTTTNKAIESVAFGVSQHRFFDSMSPLSDDDQHRLDSDRATLTVQILIALVSDIDTPQLHDALIKAGFSEKVADATLRYYPEALY
jgi:hypothetical protein